MFFWGEGGGEFLVTNKVEMQMIQRSFFFGKKKKQMGPKLLYYEELLLYYGDSSKKWSYHQFIINIYIYIFIISSSLMNE
jgi:hypothetical protein